MAYLDDIGLGQLWDRISDLFSRKTQTAFKQSFDDGILYLYSFVDGILSTVNLKTYFASKQQAVNHLNYANGIITAINVDGGQNGDAIDVGNAISTATGSLRYCTSAQWNSRTKVLTLLDQNGSQLSTVTLD